MNEHRHVLLQAINAGLKGDIEALWVAKLLLTLEVTSRTAEEPRIATSFQH